MLRLQSVVTKYRLALLLLISALLRLILASQIELGNDEVYYINYALYPDLSHFDHPPMIGWLIQLFTLNLTLSSEMWIRLGSVVAGTISTLLIYRIGLKLNDKETGWYAALLYNVSIYGFVITGIFTMPDSPQMLFWLLTVLLLLEAMDESAKHPGGLFLLAGVAGGLALLSKYTSIFLFIGTLLYFIKNRKWFGKWYVYAAVAIGFLLFTPVLYWNMENGFVSFTFHTDRVELNEGLFRFDYFAKELGGQMLYNNPFSFIMLVGALIALFRKKLTTNNDKAYLLVCISLPLILIFLGISLFRSTLPHWSGPAYVTMIPLVALWLRQQTAPGREGKLVPVPLRWASGYFVMVLLIAVLQLSQGLFLNKGIDAQTGKRLGIKDITLDMYGWRQLSNQFEKLYTHDLQNRNMGNDPVIISQRWFPAANIDYYVARPSGIKVLTLGVLERTHKYAWITQQRGSYHLGMDAYFISSSYDFADPCAMYTEFFTTIESPDTIPVYRKDLLVEYFYVWRMKDLVKIPPADLTGKDLQ